MHFFLYASLFVAISCASRPCSRIAFQKKPFPGNVYSGFNGRNRIEESKTDPYTWTPRLFVDVMLSECNQLYIFCGVDKDKAEECDRKMRNYYNTNIGGFGLTNSDRDTMKGIYVGLDFKSE